MKKRQLGSQCLVSQLTGRIIFDRHDLRALAVVEAVIFRASDLTVSYYACRMGGIDKAFIRADQTATFGQYLSTNDVANFGDADEFVRDGSVITDDCRLIGYQVRDTQNRKIGRVSDISISMTHLQASRLHIRPPFLQGWHTTNLVIGRNSVVDIRVKERTIIIQGSEKLIIQPATEATPA